MFNQIKSKLFNLLPREEKGQDFAEYALLLALIALVVIVAIPGVAAAIAATFTAIAAAL
jgi:Flp pilus assembly pilin Flp